jgi:hypothetical protein
MAREKQQITIRSSAAEYLTFVAASGEGGVEAVYADENVWLSQKMMGVLYNVNVRTINEHLKNIFADSELQEDSVIRKFRITAADGKNYNTQHYNLKAIIAVGYKVNSERARQFALNRSRVRLRLPSAESAPVVFDGNQYVSFHRDLLYQNQPNTSIAATTRSISSSTFSRP